MDRSAKPNGIKSGDRKTKGGEEVATYFTPTLGMFKLPTYGKFAFTVDNVLLIWVPRPLRTTMATTAMSAKISAYSTKLWPLRDFRPTYSFRRAFFISFTSFI